MIIAGVVGSFIGDKAHLLFYLTEYRSTPADYFFYYVTLLGEPHGFIFFGLLLWFISWKRMLTVPVTGIIVTIVSFLLKQVFQSERPILYLDKMGWDGPMSVLDYHIVTGHTSFPSGHSMAGWALFTLMAAHIRKPWFSILCLFLATAVSISRIYLVVHFLRDVVVGAMVGIALGYGVYYYYNQLDKEKIKMA